MDIATFRRLLAKHGPELERWPDADAAVALMAASTEAQDLFATTTAQAASEDHPADPALVDRIMGAVRKG